MESIGCIQDCFLVREVQGGNQAAFEQFGTRPRSGRSKTRASDHLVAERCTRHLSSGISEGLQEARRLPVRVLLLYLDSPHCHRPLPRSPMEESKPYRE